MEQSNLEPLRWNDLTGNRNQNKSTIPFDAIDWANMVHCKGIPRSAGLNYICQYKTNNFFIFLALINAEKMEPNLNFFCEV